MNKYIYTLPNGKVFITFASDILEADVKVFDYTGVKAEKTILEIKFNIEHYGNET